MIPDRSYFSSWANQEHALRGLSGYIQCSLRNELALTHTRRPERGLLTHAPERHADAFFFNIIFGVQAEHMPIHKWIACGHFFYNPILREHDREVVGRVGVCPPTLIVPGIDRQGGRDFSWCRGWAALFCRSTLATEISPLVTGATIGEDTDSGLAAIRSGDDLQLVALLFTIDRCRVRHVWFRCWAGLAGTARCWKRNANQHQQGERCFANHTCLHQQIA